MTACCYATQVYHINVQLVSFYVLLKPDLIKRALLWIKTTLQGTNTYSFSVVIWNLDKKEAICGAPAAVPSAGTSYVVAFSNHNDELFVTSGK